MIRGTDGLDYEDLTARLLDQPAKTVRNDRIRALRAGPKPHSPVFVRAYLEIYDAYLPGGIEARRYPNLADETKAHRAAFQHACIESSAHDGASGLSARERGAW